MQKKGISELEWTIPYIVITLAFFIALFVFVNASRDNTAYWEDYYAKNIALLLDRASSGEEFYLDLTRATAIASSNGQSLESVVTFDNVHKEVIVSLKQGSGTRYSFFSDIVVNDWSIGYISGGVDVNRLHFFVK